MIKLNRSTYGWIFYDVANSAFATIVLAVIYNRYYAEVVAGGADGVKIDLFFTSLQVPGAAMWSFLVAFSTAIVAFSSPILGAMADEASLRKRMLFIYCYLGVCTTIALTFVQAGDVVLGGVLFIIANFGFAGGNVFYNAFLIDVSSRESYGRVSGISWGFGYLGGGICLVLNLIMLKKPELLGFPAGSFDVGDCLVVAGIWWGVLAIPTMIWLKDPVVVSGRSSLPELARKGWLRMRRTVRDIRKYKQLVRFLFAYLIFNDGIETVIIMASIFGAEVVGLSAVDLIAFFIIIQVAGFIGSLGFGWLADSIGNRKSLLICLGIWLVVVIWAYKLGWFLDLKRDFYIIGIIAGMVMGGSQTVSRSMQAFFTPPDQSAEFFGFYAVAGRFASIFGPLIFGLVILITGGIQLGILILGIFFLVGGAILWTVDEKSGHMV